MLLGPYRTAHHTLSVAGLPDCPPKSKHPAESRCTKKRAQLYRPVLGDPGRSLPPGLCHSICTAGRQTGWMQSPWLCGWLSPILPAPVLHLGRSRAQGLWGLVARGAAILTQPW